MTTANTYDAIRRRPVGKVAWKVTIDELIESERTTLQHLRSIANRHPHDTETQRAVASLTLEAAERLAKLHELRSYRESSNDHEPA